MLVLLMSLSAGAEEPVEIPTEARGEVAARIEVLGPAVVLPGLPFESLNVVFAGEPVPLAVSCADPSGKVVGAELPATRPADIGGGVWHYDVVGLSACVKAGRALVHAPGAESRTIGGALPKLAADSAAIAARVAAGLDEAGATSLDGLLDAKAGRIGR